MSLSPEEIQRNPMSELGTISDVLERRSRLAKEYSPAKPTDRISSLKSKPEVLILSSSLFVDRVFLYTRFLDQLNSKASARVWATSSRNPHFRKAWSDSPALVEEFPEVLPFKEFPYNYLRRLNEYAWDFRQRPPSRMSMMRHIWNTSHKASVRALKVPARALALLKAERQLENQLERLLLTYQRSPEALKRLREN